MEMRFIRNDRLERQATRRILALVLPHLLCELAEAPLLVTQAVEQKTERSATRSRRSIQARARSKAQPLGVLLQDTEQEHPRSEVVSSDLLAAVNAVAFSYGVRAGQSIAEASVVVENLRVCSLVRSRVEQALGQIAEVTLKFGPRSSIESPRGIESRNAIEGTRTNPGSVLEIPDTVWLDITGVAHLFGGEEALALELASLIRGMGHRVRIAIADGPLIAQALARWGAADKASKDTHGIIIAAANRAKDLLLELPITALPVTKEQATWLFRCGVRKVSDLQSLPKAAATARLGENAAIAFDFLEGRDEAPLRVYQVPALPFEELSFEEGVVGSEPLLFILRGLIARLSTRLEARGQAARGLMITFVLDRSIAVLRGHKQEEALEFSLPAPIFRQDELNRIVTARVRRLVLGAPVKSVRIELTQITRAEKLQLGFDRVLTGASGDRTKGPESLPVILAELEADIGNSSFGVLEQVSSHLPEKKSKFVSAEALFSSSFVSTKKRAKSLLQKQRDIVPTRLLQQALPFKAELQIGETVVIDHQLFTLKQAHFERRLDHVEWWQGSGVSRDYWRLWLTSPVGDLEALVFVDRKNGRRYLQALCD